jgi:SAM-dependent methyltransferase
MRGGPITHNIRSDLRNSVKDIAVNRSRVGIGEKVRIAWLALRENGVLWTMLFGVYWTTSSVADKAYAAMNRLRQRKGNPGLNSLALNKAIWNAWDWQRGGEEWTVSPQWKVAVISGVLEKFIPPDVDVVEIGPGGGRWTEPLLQRAKNYVGIDVSKSAIDLCRQRFASYPNASFLVGSGNDLAQVADSSVDAIWSFDVFVHINHREVAGYVNEFWRVLRQGGVGVIHHGAVAGAQGGWRSDLSHEAMLNLLAQRGLQVSDSFRDWSVDDREYQLDTYADVITVFRKLLGHSPITPGIAADM